MSGDDTVSLINSSMESDDMAWPRDSNMLGNHSSSERSNVYDENYKETKMAKLWSLACLLNCPRQKRVSISSPLTDMYLDRGVPLDNIAESLYLELNGNRTQPPTHFDLAEFDLQVQECTFDSTLSPLGYEVYETSIDSVDPFLKQGEKGDDSESIRSHGSVDEIVKEQHEFAQMLEFWLRQAQLTVERDDVEVANANKTKNKENRNQQLITEDLASNAIAIVDENIIAMKDDVIAASNMACSEHKQVNQIPFQVRTRSFSFNSGDPVQTAKDHIAEHAPEHVAEEKEAISTKEMSAIENDETIDCKILAWDLESQDMHNEENTTGTELDNIDTCKRDRGRIENLIQFWNKTEPKRLGKPRYSVSREAREDAKNDIVSSITADRIQPSHWPDHTKTSMVSSNEDWISRLTVSRTRGLNEILQNANGLESTTDANQTTTTCLASSNGFQKNQFEGEISFWSPRLFFIDSNVSTSASGGSSHRDDCSLSSGKSEFSSISWFGMVGFDPISDDSSIRRRLKNYKAEKDPEDLDFDESRQRSSPPLMLDKIDNLVAQLSNDYVEALSGLEISG